MISKLMIGFRYYLENSGIYRIQESFIGFRNLLKGLGIF